MHKKNGCAVQKKFIAKNLSFGIKFRVLNTSMCLPFSLHAEITE